MTGMASGRLIFNLVDVGIKEGHLLNLGSILFQSVTISAAGLCFLGLGKRRDFRAMAFALEVCWMQIAGRRVLARLDYKKNDSYSLVWKMVLLINDHWTNVIQLLSKM